METSSPVNPPKGNRWYDKNATISRAFELFEKMVHQHRLIVARGVINYTEENKILGTPEDLKSFGHEKVLGLIQSKAKRRWYDQDPMLHKAVNNILLMGERDRQNVSYRLLVALESIETYLKQCQDGDKLVDTEEIDQIVSDVFSRNFDDLVDLTGDQQDKKIRKKPDDTKSKVVDDDAGMKLSAILPENQDG